jgi:hypothetical protein
MLRKWRRIAVLLLLLPACSDPTSAFKLTEFAGSGASGFHLNEPVVFRFSREVDRSSISARTVAVVDEAMKPAQGSWIVKGRELIFAPRMPVACDGGDAGLKPGRTYTAKLEGFPSYSSVLSTDGDHLDRRYRRTFRTVPEECEGLERFVDLAPDSGPKLVSVQNRPVREIGWNGNIVEAGSPLLLEFSKPLYPPSVVLSRAQLNVVNQEGVVDREYDLIDLVCRIVEQEQDRSLVAVEPAGGFQAGTVYKLWRESLDFVDFGGKGIEADRFNYLSIDCTERDSPLQEGNK